MITNGLLYFPFNIKAPKRRHMMRIVYWEIPKIIHVLLSKNIINKKSVSGIIKTGLPFDIVNPLLKGNYICTLVLIVLLFVIRDVGMSQLYFSKYDTYNLTVHQ